MCVFSNRASLCSSDHAETPSVDQSGLQLRNQPASALRLKVCATKAPDQIYFRARAHMGTQGGKYGLVLYGHFLFFTGPEFISAPTFNDLKQLFWFP